MAAVEKGGAAAGEEMAVLVVEGEKVLDFDMLCSMVAMQTQRGGWGNLNGENEDEKLLSECNSNGGGVFRMWEGEVVYDCFDDPEIAIQSACCPCYRFGKNMKRSGFGSSIIQGSIYLILVVVAIFNLLAFVVTGKLWLLYLAMVIAVSAAMYVGCYRTRIRKKFRIQGSESSLDDCAYHLIFPCCTLSQESRTLEMNNVQDGIWHGRGDTICIGSFSEDSSKALSPPLVASIIRSPQFLSTQKTSSDSSYLSTSMVVDSSPLVLPSELSHSSTQTEKGRV